jgi:O-antigen ligase
MPQKIEKILFYAFLFFIPFQIRATISWQGSEWDSIFLYLTDLLLVGVFILGAKEVYGFYKANKLKTNLLLTILLVLALISIFASNDKTNSIFRFVKLLEFTLLYVYICIKLKKSPPEAGPPLAEKFKIKTIFSIIVYSGILQSALAIAQFYKQGSLGLKFIEAGSYTPGEAGVATFMSGTEKVMRAYGSFPHPNVLAAFLLLSIFCFYVLWLKSEKPRGPIGLIGPIGLMGLIFALFLTFSREAILTFVFISFAFFLFRFFQLRMLYHTDERLVMGKRMMALALLFVVFSLISTIIVFPYFKTRFAEISLSEEAINLRFFYNEMALKMIKAKPASGIGIGNFVNYSHNFPAFLRAANKIASSGGATGKEIPGWIYQPAHNIYLLIASEIGILGALIFIVFVLKKFLKSIKPIKPKELIDLVGPMPFVFLGFLIIGLSDHFSWTLQSGGIIFWLSLALMQNTNLKMQNDNVKLKIP